MNFYSNGRTAEQYLELACRKLPVVNRAIRQYGNISLHDYLETLILKQNSAYQPFDDLPEVVSQYVTPLLGKSIANRVASDLKRYPVVYTANHHGVDYFAQSIQGTLCFSLSRISSRSNISTIPVFSGGAVPLNNLTYPQGVLLYRVALKNHSQIPQKIPIFSNKHRRTLVAAAHPINKEMLLRTQKRLDGMVCEEKVSADIADVLQKIINEDYKSESVVQLSTYSQQSVVLNNRIWKRCFGTVNDIPELVYLEIEKIASLLLKRDLTNPKSLAHQVLFQPKLRTHVLDELNGQRASWDNQKLKNRLLSTGSNGAKKKRHDSCGTHFFWGISQSGRRIPLSLAIDGSSNERLRGVDDYGNLWEYPFSPKSVLEGVKENLLTPSLFTSFLVISLARGAVCAGGYFQAEYLPVFQKGLVRALKKTDECREISPFVAGVRTDAYLSGMVTVMSEPETGYLVPVGPMEIIAGGGIEKADIEKMRTITVRDAHLAAIMETVPDIISLGTLESNWKRKLAEGNYRLLAEKIIIK